MGTPNTTPVIAPDDSHWDIPNDNLGDAIKGGGKIAQPVLGPDGGHYLIPVDKLHDAIKGGGQIIGRTPGQAAPPALASPQSPVGNSVPEADRGVRAGLGRNVGALVHLPVSLYKAATDEPRDDNENMAAQRYGPLGLLVHRMIVRPMIEEHLKADQYAKRADNESSEEANGTLANGYTGDREMGHMHRIAGLVPLLGPTAASMVDRYLNGDKSGAVTEMGATLLETLAMGKLGKAAKEMGPGETSAVGGVKVPVPSQTAAAKIARPVAKIIGKSGQSQLEDFAARQSEAGENAITSSTKQNAAKAVEKITPPTGQPSGTQMVDFAKNFREQSWAVKETAKTLANGAKRSALEEQAGAIDELADAWDRSLKPGAPKGTKPLTNSQGQPLQQQISSPDFENFQKELRSIGDARLRQALGGKQANVQQLHALVEQLRSGENAAKLGLVGTFLRSSSRAAAIFGHVGTISGLEAGSYLLGKVLTNPRAASALANGFKVGATAPAIAEAVEKAYGEKRKGE